MIDLIGATVLGAVSVLVVFAYVIVIPASNRLRGRIASAFAIWFALVIACGATGAFGAVRGMGPAGMGIAVMLPLVALSYLVMRAGPLNEALQTIPLPALISVHAVRLLGGFLVLLYMQGRLPAPFAPAAGWGDVLIGATALPVAYLAATRAPAWRIATLLWNTLGLLDLIDAIALGVASSPGLPFGHGTPGASSDLMTTLPWILIPCFNVPLLALQHVMIFQRLWHSLPGRPVVARQG